MLIVGGKSKERGMTMNEVKLIDANALKEKFPELWNYEADYSIFKQIETLIDEAPTVEPEPIKVNIPEDIKDKLIEEMSKPRKVILGEPKTVTDCIIAYGDGFESAKRLFESKCRDCDFRKFSETFINGIVEVMTKNGIESVEQLSEILGKGNDND